MFINLSYIVSNLNTTAVTTYALHILIRFIVCILGPSLNILDSNALLLILIALLGTINVNNSSNRI